MEKIIDAVTAEICAAEAEHASLTTEYALYESALSALNARIATIVQAEVNPIKSDMALIGYRRDAAQARADLARYQALAPDEARRREEYERVRQIALGAYRNAQHAEAPHAKEASHAAYNAVDNALQTMSNQIGFTRIDGVRVTAALVQATFYPRLIALAQQLTELAGGKAAPVGSIPGEMARTPMGLAAARLASAQPI